MAKKKKSRQHYSGIGGQAVLEGVMMKNRNMYAVAVRKPDQDIEVEIDEYHSIAEHTILEKIPFVRGIFVFIDSLVLGLRSLNFSSQFYEDEDAEPTKLDKALDRISGGNGEKILMAFTMVISFLLAIALFVVVPYYAADRLSSYVRNTSLMAIIEGVIRLVIFLLYLWAITAMKDIRRLYQYHGAEHKCINCVERGRMLTVENVRRSKRFHKRCGTSFLLFVILVSIVLFFFIRVESRPMRLLLRILLIPVIAGISYEFIRLAGRSDNAVVRILSAPGLWLQHLTTKEPDDDMIEVAIASVEAIFDWRKYLRNEFGYSEEELDAREPDEQVQTGI
ncbi:MAG: DUF1385 domain-containing protein [Lachnospiraceae bacterium]|jgi:uncharacterized protein YqhQ|nr:DUF1385 domain-containing protein [Lachnospiraceae bacterium]